MKIVVLAGGMSPERDVSLSSGALVANVLMERGHAVQLLDLYLGGAPGSPFYTKESGKQFAHPILRHEPDLAKLREKSGNGECMIGEGVLEACARADAVFLALHGSIGENGRLQAVLDVCGIPYTGTGCAGSMLAMDKDLAKRMMREQGIKTASWVCFDFSADPQPQPDAVDFPCMVKPCGCGSSVGVSMVHSRDELDAAIAIARRYENRVLVEDFVSGREFSVGILGGEALPVIEIIPKSGFYNYKNKYQAERAREVCPAEIQVETAEKIQRAAEAVHRALRLGYYSRIDFIVDGNGEAWCLEANTLPGMTPTSLLPQEAKAVGISYGERCDRIVRSIGK